MHISRFKRLALALLTGTAIAIVSLPASIVAGSLTPAMAQAPDDFQQALAPYGEWRQNPRWGDVWVPDQRPRGWRPYSVGHWIYTDDWGWYWVSDEDEADWGWVTYHYGRWIFERGSGWFWVPGDQWGPAWVDWRRGDRYVGWAPLPPDDVMYEYDNDPTYWVFVEPRYVTAPRLRTFYLPPQRTLDVIRTTVIVNRAFHSGGRVGVNPGISPAFIGAASRRPIPTFRVAPRVLASTQGVNGAVPVRREEFRQRGAPRGPNPVARLTVQQTTTVIQPATTVPKAEPLRQDERGRLGTHPPRAAQGAGAPPPPPPQQAPAAQPQQTPPPSGAPPRQGPNGPRPGQPASIGAPPPGAAPPSAAPPAAAPPRQAPQFAPARPGEPPQARPERPITPQTPPPPPPAQSRPAPPPLPAPAQSRPASPPPPAVHAPPPPPPAARPAPPPPSPPPPVARPAPPPPPPPPAAARPAPPPPPAAKPAQPAGPNAKPARKPGEPEEKK